MINLHLTGHCAGPGVAWGGPRKAMREISAQRDHNGKLVPMITWSSSQKTPFRTIESLACPSRDHIKLPVRFYGAEGCLEDNSLSA